MNKLTTFRTTAGCPACEANIQGGHDANLRHANPADWIETHTGAIHAKLGEGRYVVYLDEYCYPEKAWLVEVFGSEPFGRFASVEEAKAAAISHAMTTYGDATLGVLPAGVGIHGMAGKCV